MSMTIDMGPVSFLLRVGRHGVPQRGRSGSGGRERDRYKRPRRAPAAARGPAARRGRPPKLSREAILAAALDLLDREGADALTMRRLAAQLGVEAMSLYRHVADRAALLAALADRLAAEIEPHDRRGDWAEALRAFAGDAARDRPPPSRRPSSSSASRDARTRRPRSGRSRTCLAGLRRDGFTPARAIFAYRLVATYARGYALAEITGFAIECVPHAPLPAIRSLSRRLAERAERGQTSAPGLETILAGLRAEREAQRTAAPPAYRYVVADVFTDTPLEGNAVAVFTQAGGLDAGDDARVSPASSTSRKPCSCSSRGTAATRWIRIFTPRAELPFAGHPVLGAAFVLAGEREPVRLETGRGIVPVALERDGHVGRLRPHGAADSRRSRLFGPPGGALRRARRPRVAASRRGAMRTGPTNVLVTLENEDAVARAGARLPRPRGARDAQRQLFRGRLAPLEDPHVRPGPLRRRGPGHRLRRRPDRPAPRAPRPRSPTARRSSSPRAPRSAARRSSTRASTARPSASSASRSAAPP